LRKEKRRDAPRHIIIGKAKGEGQAVGRRWEKEAQTSLGRKKESSGEHSWGMVRKRGERLHIQKGEEEGGRRG